MLEAGSKTKGWSTVAFGDVVQHVKDKVDPEESGLERYVAGEHMDTDDLRIRRWGEIGNDYLGPAFHMRFKPGHVLYGSRRTYLRKVALADFEGITANTTYVLQSKDPGVLLPELLPFIMQTETFHEHSKRESKGSVNPYVNFSDLAWYEFALPPLAEQQRIVEALQASNGVANRLDLAAQELRLAKAAMEVEVIAKPLGLSGGSLHLMKAEPTGDWQVLTGQDLIDQGYVTALQDGNHGSQYPRASELGTEGIPYIAASDISDDGDIDLRCCKRIRPERAAKLRIAPAITGDVILTHNATVGRVTRLPEWPTEIVASTSTTYYRCDPNRLDPDYLRWFFESAVFQLQLGTIMRQSTRNQVPITTQKRLLFAVPPLEHQQQLAGLRAQFLLARRAIRSRLGGARELNSVLLRAYS